MKFKQLVFTFCTFVTAFSAASAATITVNTTDGSGNTGDGQCSLIEAILSASLNFALDGCAAGSASSLDTINFDSSLFTPPLNLAIINSVQTLTIGNGDLQIIGPTNGWLIISGNNSTPVFRADQLSTDTLRMENFTIRDGANTASGGGIHILDGTQTLDLNNMIVTDNLVDGDGAGLFIDSEDPITVNITDSEFTTNMAGGRGAAIGTDLNANTSINVDGTVFTGNESLTDGGGISMSSSSTQIMTANLNISDSVFVDNEADNDGGAVYFNDFNGLRVWRMAVVDSRFSQNRSITHFGGAIYANAKDEDSVTIRRSSFIGNSADVAGAVYLREADFDLINNSFMTNTASTTVGGLSVDYRNTDAGNVGFLIANTFHRNDGLIHGPSIPAEDLFIASSTLAAGGLIRVTANLFDSLETDGDDACARTGNPSYLISTHNLANDSDCQFAGATNDVVSDLRTTRVNVTDPVHTEAIRIRNASSAVDAWTEADCVDSGNSPLDVDMLGNRRITGTPLDGNPLLPINCDIGAWEAVAGQTLTIATSGTGSGSVSSDISGIDCGLTCVAAFASDETPQLSATADPGSTFVSWNGDCSGNGTCSPNMSSNRTVTAQFDLATTHTVTVSLTGDGSGVVNSNPSGIACEPLCMADFLENETVTLTAVADPLSLFTGWSGVCSGTGTCVLSITSDQSVTANFESLVDVLDVIVDGPGSVLSVPSGIDCPSDCDESYTNNEFVQLFATPGVDAIFFGWGGDCSGTGTCEFTMNQDRTVTAEFDFIYTLTTALDGSGSVTSTDGNIDCPATSCTADYRSQTFVTLNATAAPGWVFDHWSGNCNGSGICMFSMNQDETVTAHFTQVEQVLTVGLGGNGTGSVISTPVLIDCPGTCVASYPQGETAILTAQSDPGMQFDGWGGACSGEPGTVCSVLMDADKSVTALFSVLTFDFTVSVTGLGSVTSLPAGIDCPSGACTTTFDGGQIIELTATPLSGNSFIGWTGDCAGSGPSCMVLMDSAKTVSALFTAQDAIFMNGFE